MAFPVSDIDCPKCYDYAVAACLDEIFFELGLDAGTDYTILIEDMFGNQYTVVATTNGSGQFSIDTTDATYPEGFFAVDRFVSVAVLGEYLQTITFTIDDVEYDSICLHINPDLIIA